MALDARTWVPRLFGSWDVAGIPYAVLRNHERLPADPGNDLDVLVQPGKRREALHLLRRSIVAMGGAVHHVARFACDSVYFHDRDTLRQFHVDLFDRLLWRSVPILDPTQVLGRRRHVRGIAVPSRADEAVLNLLTRPLYGGEIRDKYRAAIVEQASEERFGQVLSAAVGKSLGLLTIDDLRTGRWKTIEDRRNGYRRALVLRAVLRRPGRVLVQAAADAWRLAHRAVRPPGLFVVLVGPDGAGKTAAGLALREGLSGTFYRELGLYLHWKARVVKRPSDPTGTPCADPHGAPPRSRVSSVLFLAHVAEMAVAHWLKVWPVLFKNGLVLVDRYYYDFLVDPRRYRLRVPTGLAWTGYRLVPHPDLVLLFDAPTEVLRSRKREVSAEETERQRKAYRDVCRRLDSARTIDATQPLDRVAAAALRACLETLAARVSAPSAVAGEAG